MRVADVCFGRRRIPVQDIPVSSSYSVTVGHPSNEPQLVRKEGGRTCLKKKCAMVSGGGRADGKCRVAWKGQWLWSENPSSSGGGPDENGPPSTARGVG